MVMTLRRRSGPPAAAAAEEGRGRRGGSSSRKKKKSRVSDNAARSVSAAESADSDDSDDAENRYEKSREQRIRENKERLEKLGILSLSSQFHLHSKSKPKPKPKPVIMPRPRSSSVSFPRRISPRIRQQHYSETSMSLKDMGIAIPDAWKPEVYTHEDERLLGKCDEDWTLNVDGYGEDGERLYDPVNGTSCHQCRQKTLRKHTFCGHCRSSLGQLCGDCLYTRYGENVMEATANAAWTCPACRGICNCSRCRRAKGWPPLNILYSKVVESGFKSVAHYLILTRRAGAMPMEKESEDETRVHALPEADTQAPVRNQGSDTSAEWSGSDDEDDGDSDDDDSDVDSSKTHKKIVQTQCPETHDEAADTNEGFGDPTP